MNKLYGVVKRVIPGISVAILSLVVGSAAVYAATNTFNSQQVELGTRTGGAVVVADTSASGGNAVRFAENPAPTGELMGWEINPTNIGLAPHGLSCDTLPEYTGSTTPPDGTVISERRITQPLYVYRGNITITKSCIKTTSNGPYGMITTWDTLCPHPQCVEEALGQVTITDSEFDGSLMTNQQVAYTAAFMGVAILERNYIHDFGSGIAFYKTGTQNTAAAINNYVEKMRAYGNPATTGSHNESFTIRDYNTSGNPSRTMAVRGNYFKIDSGNDTGSLFIQAYAGFINNVTVENNYLLGSGYQLILEYHNAGYGNNMRSINNRFTSTGFGPGYTTGGSGWAQWTDNHIYNAGQPGGKGAIVSQP